MLSEPRPRQSLLPPFIERPHMLLWVMLIPQLLLVFFNLRSWDLIQGEMDDQQVRMASLLGVYEAILFLLGIGAYFFARTRKQINLLTCTVLTLSHFGYLWLTMAWCGELLPRTVTLWILTPGQFIFYQFAFMMPALFYSALRVACFPTSQLRSRDLGYSLVPLIGLPVAWYCIAQLGYKFFKGFDIPTVVLFIFLTGSTLIVLMAFFRVMTILYFSLKKTKTGRVFLLVFAGILGPIGGLLLNQKIPFPYDFQSPVIYALTIVNGLLLVIRLPGPRGQTILWLFRAALYPFTVYFFLVFLPYLPLSLLAMIAAGAGFLILAPTALFIIHSQQLAEQGLTLIRQQGLPRTLLGAVLAFALIPAGVSVQAWFDKQHLTHAIEAAYSPDFTTEQTAVNPHRIQNALEKLWKHKGGYYVPFLTEYYGHIVFNGMVLPDHKIKEMYHMFTGSELEERELQQAGSLFGNRGTRRPGRGLRLRALPNKVDLADIQVESSTSNQLVISEVVLDMTNRDLANAEFTTGIEIPDGVLVSGYWLDVEGERVPGRIFEKKTALWVYHMIRDVTRRDPGLLFYETPRQLKLRVFPFSKDQTRQTGIQFLYPGHLNPTVKIGNQTVKLNASPPQATDKPVKISVEDRQWLVFSKRNASDVEPVQRTPYLHFIIDRSVGARGQEDALTERCLELSKEIEGADFSKVTLANYRTHRLTGDLVPIDQLEDILSMDNLSALPTGGALCPKRAIQRIMLSQAAPQQLDERGLPLSPLFVVVTANPTNHVDIGELSGFETRVPDSPYYYLAGPDKGLLKTSFSSGTPTPTTSLALPGPSVVLRTQDEFIILKHAASSTVPLPQEGQPPVDRYDPTTKSFQPLEVVESTNPGLYAQGLHLWADYHETVVTPKLLDTITRQLVHESQEHGILTPLSSYIVVENSAQWKMLERKEKQALGSHHALDFDEFQQTPAPPILLLLPFAWLFLRFRRKSTA